jgi:hypothetical protein
MSIPKTIFEGWRTAFRTLWRFLKYLWRKFEECLAHLHRSKDTPARRNFREVCCFTPPPEIRARPDPCIYSQDWFELRHIAFVWDNPDFRIFDVATGNPAAPLNLQPNTDYDVEATIHNNSFMAAIGTSVSLKAFEFGIGTSEIADLGTVIIDVPGMGTATVRVRWRTPAVESLNCLKAFISHPDDANPLNNVGQHNTRVAKPASRTRTLTFPVGNRGLATKNILIRMDGYQLPKNARRPESYKERQSLQYLRLLQAKNNSKKFPVPEYLNARLSHQHLEIPPGRDVELTLELTPPPKGSGMHSVNVHGYEGDSLIGGITVYVLEEGE